MGPAHGQCAQRRRIHAGAGINGAVEGTSVWSHQRNESSPTDVNSIYGRLLWRAEQAGVADTVRAIIWHQGESDSITPYGDYLAAWTAMHNGWLMDYPNLEGAYTFQVRAGAETPPGTAMCIVTSLCCWRAFWEI